MSFKRIVGNKQLNMMKACLSKLSYTRLNKVWLLFFKFVRQIMTAGTEAVNMFLILGHICCSKKSNLSKFKPEGKFCLHFYGG